MGAPRVQKRRLLGVDLVTIPLADYAALLDCRRQLSERVIDHTQFTRPSRSMIERNPEVAVFLLQRFGTAPMKDILKACRRRFGRQRAPSQSVAYAYWKKVRKEAALS